MDLQEDIVLVNCSYSFFCVDMHYCAFKPICGLGLGLVKSVLFPSLCIININ